MIPQNITDDLAALDAAITAETASAAQVASDQTAVTTAQATLDADTTANTANQQAAAAAVVQLDTDIAAWATGSTPAAEVMQVKDKKKKLLAKRHHH